MFNKIMCIKWGLIYVISFTIILYLVDWFTWLKFNSRQIKFFAIKLQILYIDLIKFNKFVSFFSNHLYN